MGKMEEAIGNDRWETGRQRAAGGASNPWVARRSCRPRKTLIPMVWTGVWCGSAAVAVAAATSRR